MTLSGWKYDNFGVLFQKTVIIPRSLGVKSGTIKTIKIQIYSGFTLPQDTKEENHEIHKFSPTSNNLLSIAPIVQKILQSRTRSPHHV